MVPVADKRRAGFRLQKAAKLADSRVDREIDTDEASTPDPGPIRLEAASDSLSYGA